jgi:Spy/CpxP family protein refolding chaperone
MAFASFVVGVLAGAAAACGVMWALKRRRPQIRGYLDLIDLTEEQRRRVEQIRERFLPYVAGVREKLRERRMELADLLFAAPLDRDRMKAVVEAIAGLQLNLEQGVIDHIIEENGLLTPDQQRQFHQVIIDQFRGGGLGVHDVRGQR